MGNTRTLHSHSNSHRTYLSISHILTWELFFPSDHLSRPHQALIQTTSRCYLIIISHHAHTLTYHIFHTDLYRIHANLTCQFIDYRFQGKHTLSGSITTVSARCTDIGIDHIKGMTVRFQIGCIQRNGLMSGQACRRRSMIAIGTGIGQVINFNGTDSSIVIGAHLYSHFHLMTRGTGNLAFLSGIKQLRRLLCHPCHKCRINL